MVNITYHRARLVFEIEHILVENNMMQFVALDLCYFDRLWLLVKNIYILIQHFINGANQKESSLAIANF